MSVFSPIRPTVLKSPAFAMPVKSKENTSGAMIIFISFIKMSLNICIFDANGLICSGSGHDSLYQAPSMMPAIRPIIICVVRDGRFNILVTAINNNQYNLLYCFRDQVTSMRNLIRFPKKYSIYLILSTLIP